MKIACPNCSFTGTVPDDKVRTPGIFATCPQCKTRFELIPPPPEPLPTVTCPKCGASQEGGEFCLGCGIVFAKYNRAQEMREPPPQPEPEPLPPLPPPKPSVLATFRMNWGGLVMPLLLIAALTWFFFTPHLAVRGMRAAAEARDATKLSQYVNFPALKESLKSAFTAKLAAEAAKSQEGNPFAALGAAFAAAFISPLIDALVTPESLAMIMKGDKPELGKTRKEPSAGPPETETTMSYEGLHLFVVSLKAKGSAEEPVGLVFSREGFFSPWRLSAIRLP
jgi:hypothetical protein